MRGAGPKRPDVTTLFAQSDVNPVPHEEMHKKGPAVRARRGASEGGLRARARLTIEEEGGRLGEKLGLAAGLLR